MSKCKGLAFFLLIFFNTTIFSQKRVDIYFDFNKYDINNQASKKINSWIAEGKDYKVTKIFGFCDEKGTNNYNDTLARKRIESVLIYLKESDFEINPAIEVRAFGEDFMQDKIQDKNRRVTILYSIQSKDSIIKETNPEVSIAKAISKLKVGDVLNLKNIYFYNNSARVVTKSESYLYDLYCVLKDNPNLKIEIQGHICCKSLGEPENISSARARFIYNYLVAKRIERSRLSYKGYGVTKPIHPIPEKNESQENENRRVEIKIIENRNN
jgi:outer membrane protein OmpA-like peptidoglycan-associated protein